MQQALGGIAETAKRAPACRCTRAIANTIPAGIRRSICSNLLTVSEAVTRSALERKESRGAHFRDDFPEKDPKLRDLQYGDAQRPGRRDADLARAAVAA